MKRYLLFLWKKNGGELRMGVYCGEKVKIHEYRSFFREDFLIKAVRTSLNKNGKDLFEFSVWEDDFYLGSFDVYASSLKKAKLKLSAWLRENFSLSNHETPYYNSSYHAIKTNYINRINYVNKIIRDKGEDLYKYCPICDFKNYAQASYCKSCNHEFFRRN
jgi:hypothetical protein